MKLVLLSSETEAMYTDFVSSCPCSLVYHSLKYRDVLRLVLSSAKDVYFMALDDAGEIVGVLPTFLMEGRYGKIVNSLPFFGSHGGVVQKELSLDVHDFLVRSVDSWARENRCAAMTLVSSPRDTLASSYKKELSNFLIDERISLVNQLPVNSSDVEQELMTKYASSRRRNVRRASRCGVECKLSENIGDALDFTRRVHNENMDVVGGPHKELTFYEAIVSTLERGRDYQVYEASVNGVVVASLLILIHNKTAEYFVPAVLSEWRNAQPLAGLIHFALQDVSKQGVELWNWGGTGLAMKGVYNFKKKWGAVEGRYYYYTCLYSKEGQALLGLSPDTLLKEYPNFFVVPFGCLEA